MGTFFCAYIIYQMVEAMANGIEDRLIDGFSFKLAPGASYITDRRSVPFIPKEATLTHPNQELN